MATAVSPGDWNWWALKPLQRFQARSGVQEA